MNNLTNDEYQNFYQISFIKHGIIKVQFNIIIVKFVIKILII
jgi:hypothetical protein